MEEQLIEFDTAILAKEKGLTYNEVGQSFRPDGRFTYGRNDEIFYPAPTQSILQKWLREKHKINVLVCMFDENREDYFSYMIIKRSGNRKVQYPFENYEKALEEGLLKALKLIK